MITNGRPAKISVYPPCTSLGRIRCFYSFCRLVESASYVESVRVRIPTAPASTILATEYRGLEKNINSTFQDLGRKAGRFAARPPSAKQPHFDPRPVC